MEVNSKFLQEMNDKLTNVKIQETVIINTTKIKMNMENIYNMFAW